MAGGAETPNIAALPAIARLAAQMLASSQILGRKLFRGFWDLCDIVLAIDLSKAGSSYSG
jgi:hypothetical protein